MATARFLFNATFSIAYMLLIGGYFCQSKFAAHASTSATRPTIEESIPVVDKVVDDGWGSPRASPTASSSGILHYYFTFYPSWKLFVWLSKTIPF
jgi:hypothetical protein